MESYKFDLDQIEAYLQNTMDEEERKLFEEYMGDSPEFAEEVSLHSHFLAALEAQFNEELKQKLREATEEKTPFQVIKMKQRLVFSLAASLSILIMASYFLLYNVKSSEEVFMAYYEPYMNVASPNARGGQQGINKAFQLYDQKDFEAAADAFKEALKQAPGDDSMRFYMAVSLISIGEASEATSILEDMSQDEEGLYFEPSQWYLGMAYLQKGLSEEAKIQFEVIVKEESSYSEKAKAILNEL
ncbi:tetratricopeptide repeat protein [Flammeovirgaceae bacterium SG7u.111]|nr:tetratricopeptide repeat protein [Flammeovirgaceae bacterium SG7u.132]WPO35808.1 tetratricopeptide repeat protein [Flammeovirgaceae bacterium SG7u.111]